THNEIADYQHHRRSSHHPDQKDVRVGEVGLPARSDETQDCVLELDANLHLTRPPDRIDPERTLDVGSDLVGKGAVELVEERFVLRRRKFAGRQYSYRQAKPGEANVEKTGDLILGGA